MKWVRVTETKTIKRDVFVPVPQGWNSKNARMVAEDAVKEDESLVGVKGEEGFTVHSTLEPWRPSNMPSIVDDPPVSLTILGRLTDDELASLWADAKAADCLPDGMWNELSKRFERDAHRKTGLAKLTAAEKAALGVS